jgi:hypothetical protein
LGRISKPVGAATVAALRALNISLQAKFEVRLDVAEIIRWIVIGYYLLT